MSNLSQHIAKVVKVFVAASGIVFFTGFILVMGYTVGYIDATEKAQSDIKKLLAQASSAEYGDYPTPTPNATPVSIPASPRNLSASWGGPELWASVNNERVAQGVNPLTQRDELCTIASIRLNQLLEMGKLDGHEGFGKLPDEREDLKWIFEKYNNISEFLVSGAQSSEQAVELWSNTLGHKKLLTGGEYVWGCIYAQNTFGVAITAF